jgi:hypothetical protein
MSMRDNGRRINFIGLTGTMLSNKDASALASALNSFADRDAGSSASQESQEIPEAAETLEISFVKFQRDRAGNLWPLCEVCNVCETVLKVRAELRQTKVDLLDAEAEVSELFDKYRHWKGETESKPGPKRTKRAG